MGKDWDEASGLLAARPVTDRVPDSVLDELVTDLVAQRGLTEVATIVAADSPSAVVSVQPIATDTAPEQESSQPPAGSRAPLMDLVLAAGLCGYSAAVEKIRNRLAGHRRRTKGEPRC
jgi:hypothetical protein